MLKVLIVEIDVETIELVTRVIEERIKNTRIVGIVNNGSQAVTEVINTDPDLIIIAIRIAGMNGLEAIKQIRSMNQKVRIIIVSTYDYFEFAREAMLLNVNEYLLKPQDLGRLYEVIHHELECVRQEHERIDISKNEETLFQNALRLVESSFVYSVIYNSEYEMDIEYYQQLLGVGTSGYIMNIEFATVALSNHMQVGKATEQIYRRLKSIINQKANCAIGPMIMNHIMVFIDTPNTRETKEDQQESIKLAKQIIKGIKDTFGLEVNVGIGSVKPIDTICESYLESMRCFKYKYEHPIVHSKEVRQKLPVIDEYNELIKKLVETVKYNKQDSYHVFIGIVELLRPLPSLSRINKLIELFIILDYEVGNHQKGKAYAFENIMDIYKYGECSLEEQEAWAVRRFHTLLKVTRPDKNDRKTSIINVALEYIARHYNEELPLNEIAEYVNLSPQHFSKIFKEATNYNYVEYVNNLRISKAKEFMNNTDRTIKEVCFLVGYQDPNYFSRIFKKYVGITPTEYVKERAD